MDIGEKLLVKNDICLVMLHGNSLDPTIFNPIIKEIVEKVKVATFCLPGHGNTPKLENYKFDELGCSVIERINKIAGKKIVFAHSLGGHLILQNLEKLSGIKHVICVGTPPLRSIKDMSTAFTQIGTLMYKEKWEDNELDEIISSLTQNNQQLIREVLIKSDPGFRKALNDASNFENFKNEIENLQKTKFKVSLVFSNDDKYIDIEYCQNMETLIENENVECVFLNHGGHLPFFNFPVDFFRLMNELLTSV